MHLTWPAGSRQGRGLASADLRQTHAALLFLVGLLLGLGMVAFLRPLQLLPHSGGARTYGGGGWSLGRTSAIRVPAPVGTPTGTLLPPTPTRPHDSDPHPVHANLLDHPYHITSEFGHYPNGGPHYGLDLDAWSGTIIYAPVAGTVTAVQRGCVAGDQGCGKGWGNHVWFQSAETGHYVLIGHFQRLNDWVQEGATFNAGAPFGESGSTGFSSGPHVHFQVNPDGMGNPGSTNPAWEFPWLHCTEPVLGALFGAACP